MLSGLFKELYIMRTFILMLSVVSLFMVSCRDDDDDTSCTTNNCTNNINNPNNDDTIDMVQNPSNASVIADGDPVNLKNVVVTAIDSYGSYTGNFWVSEPGGGAYKGVKVFNFDSTADWFTSLQVGDIVDIQGDKDEYNYNDEFEDSETEVVNAIVSPVGSGTPVDPVDIQASDLTSVATGEQWEGVLVRLSNVRVLSSSQNGTRYEVELYQSSKIQDDLVDVSTIQEGDCLAHVTGVVTYFYGYYIVPRSAADFEVSANDGDCPMIAQEVCDDEIDNDGNGFVDCDDFACIGSPDCPAKMENDDTLCADGIDNDDDGLTDCADPSCYGHPDVTVCTETNCTDGVDNDGDDFTDCADFDCLYSEPSCQVDKEVTDETCSDGIDNDGNGFVDCADFACRYCSADGTSDRVVDTCPPCEH